MSACIEKRSARICVPKPRRGTQRYAENLGSVLSTNRWHGKHVLRKFVANLPSLKNLPIVALTLYTLFMFWVCILLPIIAIGIHRWWIALIPPILLLLPFVVISLIKTLRFGRLVEAPALITLYTTYFLSRAAALTLRSGRNHR